MQKVVPSLLALRKLNPEGLAWLLTEHRVTRGIRWLKRHAVVGWHRNLFEPQLRENGGSRFRARDECANECVLALAFECRADLAGPEGYVTYATVAKYYDISEPHLLGFEAYGFPKRNPQVPITGALINQEWERILRLGGAYLHTTRQYSCEETTTALFQRRLAHHGLSRIQ